MMRCIKTHLNSQLITKAFPKFHSTDQLKEQPTFFSQFLWIMFCFIKPVLLGTQVHYQLLYSHVNNNTLDSYLPSPSNILFAQLSSTNPLPQVCWVGYKALHITIPLYTGTKLKVCPTKAPSCLPHFISQYLNLNHSNYSY